MLKYSLIVFMLVVTLSCTNNEQQEAPITSTFDTTAIIESLTDSVVHRDSVLDGENGAYQMYYIVCVEEGTDYGKLRAMAIKATEKLKLRFDTLERGYDDEKKRVILPCGHPDEIYACEYLLRRHGDDFVSIEMRNAYPDPYLKEDKSDLFLSDTTKMYVCASICIEKRQADSLVKILKPQFVNSKVIATEIYMGCMH